jgi:transcriptional regulator with XRE-family HTH domain
MFSVMFILMFTHRLIPAPIRELEESIMPGAVAAKLDSIKEKTGIRGRQVADLVGTTPQTVSRWQQGRVDPQPSHLNRLLTLEWLASELSEFYEPGDAKVWLFSRNRLLHGATPAQLIQEDKTDEVLAVIEQLKTGAYV